MASHKVNVTTVRERSLRSMAECAAALDQFMDYDIGPNADIEGWLEQITEVEKTLDRFRSKLNTKRRK